MATITQPDRTRQSTFRRHKWLWLALSALAAMALATVLALAISPWPGSMLIRYVFEQDQSKTVAALEAHRPDGVVMIADQQYRPGDDDAYLDVHFPEAIEGDGERLPTLVWTHGGAWVSGSKNDFDPYLQMIAVEDFTVISLGYSLAPEETYPIPIEQVNDALAYMVENANRFHVDTEQIMLAGDSAGSQITSQIAALMTNPEYAAEMEITPDLQSDQLVGVALYCGYYDLEKFNDEARLAPLNILKWGTRTIMWAYTGSCSPSPETLRQMSAFYYLTPEFPATFISGGNGDPLTDAYSKPFAEKLEELGGRSKPSSSRRITSRLWATNTSSSSTSRTRGRRSTR